MGAKSFVIRYDDARNRIMWITYSEFCHAVSADSVSGVIIHVGLVVTSII